MTKAIPSGKTTSQSIQITSSKLPQVRPIDIHNYKLKQQKNRKKHSSLAKSLFSDDSLGLLLVRVSMTFFLPSVLYWHPYL